MCSADVPASAAAGAMEDVEADDLITELEAYAPKHLDLVNPLMDLTSGRKNLMSKYLSLKEDEPWPLLAEYFGVALAFAALGALIRGAQGISVKDEIKYNSPKLQRMALQTMLKGAMERLQSLAHNAQQLEEQLIEFREARDKDRIAWEEEKLRILQKAAKAESEAGELKMRRKEDAKANEKVVRIYAGQEQGWKSEKKKLRHEIDLLRRDLMKQEAGGLYSPKTSPLKRRCEMCNASEKHVRELEETLNEKEFLITTAMEESRTNEKVRKELTTRLAIAKANEAEMTEKLAEEVSRASKQELVISDITNKQHESEGRLAIVIQELENTKNNLAALSVATENHSAMTKKLLGELANLKHDSEDKDDMISTILERATVEREEKEDLSRELAEAKAKYQVAELERERWKKLAQESARLTVTGTDSHKPGLRSQRSVGNRTELEKNADLLKAHADEVESLRSAYSRQVEALEKQVRLFKAKSQEAPEAPASILTSDFQEMLTDPAFKAWFDVVKRRYAAQLEDKHRHQIETFERQLRAKDERLSVFRSKMFSMETELTQSKLEVEDLKTKTVAVERCMTAVASDKKDQEILPPLKTAKSLGYTLDTETMKISYQKLVETQMELKIIRKRLKEQETEHMTAVENAESELQQKDIQVAVLEAKLCQLQLQLEKVKQASESASSDNCQEKMFLKNLDETQESHLKEVLHSLRADGAESTYRPIDLDIDQDDNREELVQQEDSVAESARLLSKLKDMCLKEEKATAMVLFHENLESETCEDLLFSPNYCWLPSGQRFGDKSTQALEDEKDDTSVSKPPHASSVGDHVPQEDKTTAMVLFQEKQELKTCDNLLFSPDHHCFSAVQKCGDKPLLILQDEKDFTFATKIPHTISDDDTVADEEKSTAMVLFRKNSEFESCDRLFSPPAGDRILPVKRTAKQPSPANMGLKYPTKPLRPASKDENATVLKRSMSSSQSRRGLSNSNLNNKGKKNMNKQPTNSPDEGLRLASPLDDILLTQAPTKGTRPARLDMLNVLEDSDPKRKLFTEERDPKRLHFAEETGNHEDGGPKRLLFSEQSEKQDLDPTLTEGKMERMKTRTRDDIQVLGLALEVRRIEQQLAQMNKSTTDAQPLQTRSGMRVLDSKKQMKGYAGLAGRVSQFAKQIGLTGVEPRVATKPFNEVKGAYNRDPFHSDLCLHKNPLFSQEPSTSELGLLQQRAETVSENLAAIQAKLARESSPDSPDQQSSASFFPKGQLVDTVQAHLSQVQRTLRSKLGQAASEPGDSLPSKKFTQDHPKVLVKDNKKPRAAFGRRESRPLKHDALVFQGIKKARAHDLLRRLDATLR